MKTEENIVTFINNLEAENQDIECKQCKRILPKDLWSTYSAFANTHGCLLYTSPSPRDS